jgi:hypothetical protein
VALEVTIVGLPIVNWILELDVMEIDVLEANQPRIYLALTLIQISHMEVWD